jgi:hypothetical protein
LEIHRESLRRIKMTILDWEMIWSEYDKWFHEHDGYPTIVIQRARLAEIVEKHIKALKPD